MKKVLIFVIGWWLGIETLHYLIGHTDWCDELYYKHFDAITKENDDKEPVIRAFGY